MEQETLQMVHISLLVQVLLPKSLLFSLDISQTNNWNGSNYFSQTNNERFIFIQDGIIGIQFKDETANPIYWPSVYGDINIFEILPNNWYHVAVTRSSNNDINIYVNGILTRSVLNSGLIYVDNTGTNYIGSEGTSSRRFDGIIDEVIVMDRAVSANQITAMFNDDVNSYFTIHSDETNCGETWT